MKRSEINQSIDDARKFFATVGCILPHYAHWSLEEWKKAGPEYDEIRELGLGWDVTDFGSGDLNRIGRTIFTLRNGRHNDPHYPKSYAQKAMYMPEAQKSIIHFHKSKREDICNMAGGNVMIRLWTAGEDNALSEDALTVSISGVARSVTAGEAVRIVPGESITVVPGTYHQFWAEEAHGPTFTVEVSSVCDDHNDNIFYESFGCRFPEIENDEPARYRLCQDS